MARAAGVTSLGGRAKAAIRAIAGRAGYDIHRVDASSTMEAALHRLAASHPGISTIVDVGASDGRWSVGARRHFPEARFLLFEALERPHGQALRALAEDPSFQVVLAAAGDREGSIHFDAGDPFGGAAGRVVSGENDIEVPMTTIDAEVSRRDLRGPFLVKLDTHGFEVPILAGAKETLQDTAILVIEAYNFPIHPEGLRFPDMCDYVEDLGFHILDLVDVTRRPGDAALWQFDLVAARAERPEFQRTTYA